MYLRQGEDATTLPQHEGTIIAAVSTVFGIVTMVAPTVGALGPVQRLAVFF
jgi:hypothetical protein